MMKTPMNNKYTLGSLFSGSGGFEYAGELNGFVPSWNSEIKPFPMLVTQKNFPKTIQYGNISKINGAEITPVDVITFGSPCFPAGTPVLTDKGYRPIEYIRTGERVLTKNNRFMRVVKIGGTPQQDLYELDAQGILPIQATGNHPFIVRTEYKNQFTNPYEKPLYSITENDYIGVPIIKTEENPLNLTENECFDLGYYLAQKYNLIYETPISCNDLFDKLSDKVKPFANNEKITFDILNLPVRLVKAFVKGYFEYDVKYMSHKTFCKTKDIEFAINMCLAVQKGFGVGCYICKSKIFSSDTYIVTFNPHPQSPSFVKIDDFIWYPVFEVKRLDIKSDVFNIEVEKDHTYIAQNCLVHNCQDLSQAGKREGLDGSRSCLFHEAIRIIKEMRIKTNGQYPKYIVWENVMGSLTSHKGNDFRIVLEQITKIKDETAAIPMPKSGKWCGAGEILGNNYSVAWRTLDAEWWGVPQRRRRIFLVADLDGGSAGELLFKFESLSGYSPQSCNQTNSLGNNFDRGTSGTDCQLSGTGRDDRELSDSLSDDKNTGVSKNEKSGPSMGANYTLDDVASTLRSSAGMPKHSADIRGRLVIGFCGNNSATAGNLSQANDCSPVLSCTKRGSVMVAHGFDAYNSKLSENTSGTLGVNCGISTGRSTVLCINDQGGNSLNVEKGEVSPTLRAQAHGNLPIVLDRAFYNQGENANYNPQKFTDGTVPTLVAKKETPLILDDKSICLQGSMIGRKDKNGPQGNGINNEVSFTLNTLDRHAVTQKKTVRRFAPLECGRLQGFPDDWCENLAIPNPTDKEIEYWWNAWETYREITNEYKKPKTRKQIKEWLQNPTKSDEAMYIMWGNGVAVPCVSFILASIKWGLDKKYSNN